MPVARAAALLLLSFLVSFVLPRSASADVDPLLPGRVRQFVLQRTAALPPNVSVSVAINRLEDGKEIYSTAADEPRSPASVLKLVTTVAALRYLGGNYRFPTEIFVDSPPTDNDPRLDASLGLSGKGGSKNWSAGNLYVRGYGDPTLSDQHLAEIAVRVREHGVFAIKDLIIDDSLFVDPPAAAGPRPYQAALSATSLNSNCYRVAVAPSGSGLPAFVQLHPVFNYELSPQIKTLKVRGESIELTQSPPSETFNPQLSLRRVGQFFAFDSPKVTVNVRGKIGLSSTLQSYYHTVRNPVEYLGTVLKHQLELAGVKVEGQLLRGETPGSAKLLHLHHSKPLADIVRELNKLSSNFIAGQLLFALGQDSVGLFKREIGLERLASVLTSLGYARDSFRIVDASGLSPENKLTAGQMVRLLQAAYQDLAIAPDLISSLSRYGESGTLETRSIFTSGARPPSEGSLAARAKARAEGVWAKTGTLSNVSSLVGVLETRTSDRLAFAIMINGEIPKDTAVVFEDDLVRLLIEVEQ